MDYACANCTWGSLPNPDFLSGTIETIAGVLCYVARPSDTVCCPYTANREPIGVVVILPDMFGWEIASTRALADHYAQRIPAVVVVPDLFNGYSAPATLLDEMDRLQSRPARTLAHKFAQVRLRFKTALYSVPLLLATRPSVYNAKLSRLLQTLRTLPLAASGLSLALNRVGIAGFNHGGSTAVRLAHGSLWRYARAAGLLEPLVDCAFSVQPGGLQGWRRLRELERVQAPLSIAAGHDSRRPLGTLYEAERLLNCVKDNCELVVYMDAGPGLGIRAPPDDKSRVGDSVLAQHQAVLWFTRHLPAKSYEN
ncbi:hypothetical protein BROUX41_001565 [Berkeleyomyces rouxiae]|uniref:uncharacterized protein n=1 Tax=Berkeleyomyces rouxiae TaxID=2035830 RepID=UPI003B81AF24